MSKKINRDTYIPKCHDYKLIKHGCKYPEGSPKIESENMTALLKTVVKSAKTDIPQLKERLVISFRAKDNEGWYIAQMSKPLSDMKPGDEIFINCHGITKLIVQ